MSLLVELEEELGLFCEITFWLLCAGNSGGVAHIFIFANEPPRAHAGFVSQIQILAPVCALQLPSRTVLMNSRRRYR